MTHDAYGLGIAPGTKSESRYMTSLYMIIDIPRHFT
jgi:hypothetical protein